MAKRHKLHQKEFYLPEEIIHNIQSFLNTKESAQTSILSNSWYSAWSTRFVLVFDEDDFPENQSLFSRFTEKTLNRFERLNLRADKFVLQMKTRQPQSPLLANEFIISALELGVNEMVLKFDYDYIAVYILPAQVFGSYSLTRLSIDNCVIDGFTGSSSHLKSLVLRNVKTKDDVVQDILLRCPFLENLDLCRCRGLTKLNVSKLINLVEFRIAPWLLISVEFLDLDRMNVTEFRHLRRLHLEVVTIGDEFFTMFGCMFPCVEDLTLGLFFWDHISISSHSLKRLSLNSWSGLMKVQLNVPNISMLTFKADVSGGNFFRPLPSLCFDNVSKDWKSYVQLTVKYTDVIDARWFEDLRKLLLQLTLSRISLRYRLSPGAYNKIETLSATDFPTKPVVENLTICACLSKITTESLLLGLTKISCCPNLITECNECRVR